MRPSATADAAAARGESPVVLATITLPDGRVLRHATRALSVTARVAGGPYAYQPTLSGVDDLTEEIDPWSLSGSGSLTQARVEVVTTDDLAALHADWIALTAATVEIATLWDGEAWEDREVVLDAGMVQSVEVGVLGERSVLVVEAAPPATSAAVGDDTRDMGSLTDGQVDTAADAVTDLSGTAFVTVLGAPRSVPAYKIGTGGGGTNRAVLCGHKLPDLSGVVVYEDGASTGTHTPTNTLTGTESPYAQVAHATEFLAADGALTWSAANGGIARRDSASSPTRSAGDVLAYLLGVSGVAVDWTRTQRALDLLASWPIGLWLDEQAPALDIIREHLLPFLPLVELASGAGAWYAYVDPWEGQPEMHLRLGQNVVARDGGWVSSDIDEVRNSFTVLYSREEFSGEFTASVLVDADTDARCALSAELYGTRASEVVECHVAWDAATARRIGRAMAARLALPRRRVRYVLGLDAYAARAGMVVMVTDADLGISGQRGVIVARQLLGPPVVTVDLVDATPAGSW